MYLLYLLIIDFIFNFPLKLQSVHVYEYSLFLISFLKYNKEFLNIKWPWKNLVTSILILIRMIIK